MYPPVSRRAIVQPVPLMTNPGSLTMGFAGVHPRQLAPSMGTTQVGIKSRRFHLQQATTQGQEPDLSHSRDSRSRQTSLPPHQDRSDYSCAKTNTTVMAKYNTNSEEIDDPEERREAFTKESHSTNHDTQWRT